MDFSAAVSSSVIAINSRFQLREVYFNEAVDYEEMGSVFGSSSGFAFRFLELTC